MLIYLVSETSTSKNDCFSWMAPNPHHILSTQKLLCWVPGMFEMYTRWFKPWSLYPLDGGHPQPLKGSRFQHPKKVTSRIARWISFCDVLRIVPWDSWPSTPIWEIIFNFFQANTRNCICISFLCFCGTLTELMFLSGNLMFTPDVSNHPNRPLGAEQPNRSGDSLRNVWGPSCNVRFI